MNKKMKYFRMYRLIRIVAIAIYIWAVIAQSKQGSISTHRLHYLKEGEQFSGKVISMAVARSRMECTQR